MPTKYAKLQRCLPAVIPAADQMLVSRKSSEMQPCESPPVAPTLVLGKSQVQGVIDIPSTNTPSEARSGSNKRAQRNEVAYKVGQYALTLHEFTVQALLDTTGLKDSSVRTELDRMVKEGVLTRQRASGDGRCRVYRLSLDPTKRLELSQKVHAFESPPLVTIRPASRAYKKFLSLIDEIYASPSGSEKRREHLEHASRALHGAELAAGGDRAPEQVKAYLRFQRLHVAFLMQVGEDVAQHIAELATLHAYFIKMEDFVAAESVQGLRCCLESQHLQDEVNTDCTPAIVGALRLLKAMQKSGYSWQNPLLQLHRQYLQQLSEPMTMQVDKLALQMAIDLVRDDIKKGIRQIRQDINQAQEPFQAPPLLTFPTVPTLPSQSQLQSSSRQEMVSMQVYEEHGTRPLQVKTQHKKSQPVLGLDPSYNA